MGRAYMSAADGITRIAEYADTWSMDETTKSTRLDFDDGIQPHIFDSIFR